MLRISKMVDAKKTSVAHCNAKCGTVLEMKSQNKPASTPTKLITSDQDPSIEK